LNKILKYPLIVSAVLFAAGCSSPVSEEILTIARENPDREVCFTVHDLAIGNHRYCLRYEKGVGKNE
jgi:hypothetical protein